jgi:predicted DsbA family dithiol-disulfide isomerase
MDTPATKSSTVVVDVVSDVVCPWCYLGKRRLERAVASLPDVDVVVRWHPFQLDPSVPPEGMDRRVYMERKFGSLERIAPAHARLTALGRQDDIDYRFDDMTRAANTLDAHRLAKWAGEAGREEEMVERLFKANFTEALDIGDRKVLARLAGEIGLDADDIEARLASDRDLDAVQAEIAEAGRMGIEGVPFFIIGGRYGVSGAQEAETLARAIRAVASEQATAQA